MNELVLGPIVGGVSHNRVKLWGKTKAEKEIYAWLISDQTGSEFFQGGKSISSAEPFGYSFVIQVTELEPDTRYYYSLSTSPNPPDSMDPAKFNSFTTFPSPDEKHSFTFAFGSCFLPDKTEPGKIFKPIRKVQQEENIRFLMMLGDQIYADDPYFNGLGTIPVTVDEYRAVYKNTWSNSNFNTLLAGLPVFMTLDDHEVDDDWAWTSIDRRYIVIPWWNKVLRFVKGHSARERRLDRNKIRGAINSVYEHEFMHAPDLLDPLLSFKNDIKTFQLGQSGSFAYSFDFGQASFFVLDTRTNRVRRRGFKRMLDKNQWTHLEEWLLNDDNKIKFIISSGAVLFQSWGDIFRDRWSGFPSDRKRLFDLISRSGLSKVIILSGDLHSAHAVRADVEGVHGGSTRIWGCCSSPFDQKPNKYTKHTYYRIRGYPLKDQTLEFVKSELNFGLIRVDFNQEEPVITFEVRGMDGGKINSITLE